MLDRLIPFPDLVERDEIDVAASPEVAWERIRHGELGVSAPIRALFAIRTLPSRLTGHEASPNPTIRLDHLRSTPEHPGFSILSEKAPRELVVGAIGKVWHLDIPFLHVDGVDAYANFTEPDFVRVAWALRVDPKAGGSTIGVELRVDATDGGARRKFQRYFLLIAPGSRYIRRSALAALRSELGALPAEAPAATRPVSEELADVLEGVEGATRIVASALMPFLRGRRSHWGVPVETAAKEFSGDALIPEPLWGWTHGVEIDAPAREVWPWVAQIGLDRAGFYSYASLENVVGCEVRNADAIHPEWEVRPGTELRLHPAAPPLRVTEVVPGKHFVAFGAPDEAARAAGKPWMASSWLFLVEPMGELRSRFISRFRVASSGDLGTRLRTSPALLEPVGFTMDRKMLLGVKQRAEGPSVAG